MTKVAIEHTFDGQMAVYSDGYDSNITMLGQHMFQRRGFLPEENNVGPLSSSVFRPFEAGNSAQSMGIMDVLDIGNGEYWIFSADTASNSRIHLTTYSASNIDDDYRRKEEFNYKGYIIPTTTTGFITGLKATRNVYSTGTVAVNETTGAVTGSGTQFNGGGGGTPAAGGMSAGSRIGFGSTDPNDITLWYTISAINSDTTLDLTSVVLPAAIPAGTPYVIEEIRIYMTLVATTPHDPTSGGLRVVKGLNIMDFDPRGKTIPAAVTSDNNKQTYWLKDASTITMTATCGLAIKVVSASSVIVYVTQYIPTFPSYDSNLRIFKFEGRTALAGTLSAGASTAALTLQTGDQALLGLMQTKQSCCLASPTSPAGESVFVVTDTNIYRCPTSGITAASTTFAVDSMTVVPTGDTTTFPARPGWTGIEYVAPIDKFLISPGIIGNKAYLTDYNSTGLELDRTFLACSRQLQKSSSDPGIAHFVSSQAGVNIATTNGLAFFCADSSGNSETNVINVVPVGADWDFAAGTSDVYQNRIILPAFDTSSYRKYYRAYVLSNLYEGSPEMGTQVCPYRLSYRKGSDITGDVENWTVLDHSGDMSGVAVGGEDIQFMLEFRVLGDLMVMPKIYGLILECEDNGTDSHFEPSLKHSVPGSNIFAWRFKTAFGTTVPTLYVQIDDDDGVNLNVLDDTATPASGTFEKSTNDGSSWSAYNTTDKGNEITYIRYTLTSPGSTTRAQAKLQQ